MGGGELPLDDRGYVEPTRWFTGA
ncbi:hypothetical protein [Desulfosporosinus sp.]|nr:hypothetical protein [Desulfosporosinus sp.]